MRRDRQRTQALIPLAILNSLLLMLAMAWGDSNLKPCPDSPNCVSSLSSDPRSRVDPLRLRVAPELAWEGLRDVIDHWPRTTIVEQSRRYLKAETQSRLFRFVDDVEFELDVDVGVVHLRSASRTGSWDLGVNRRRVESVREVLSGLGLVEP